MSPEVPDKGWPVSEQTSSPGTHPPLRGLETSWTGRQVPGDMNPIQNRTRDATPIEAADAAVGLLKSAVEDGQARITLRSLGRFDSLFFPVV